MRANWSRGTANGRLHFRENFRLQSATITLTTSSPRHRIVDSQRGAEFGIEHGTTHVTPLREDDAVSSGDHDPGFGVRHVDHDPDSALLVGTTGSHGERTARTDEGRFDPDRMQSRLQQRFQSRFDRAKYYKKFLLKT